MRQLKVVFFNGNGAYCITCVHYTYNMCAMCSISDSKACIKAELHLFKITGFLYTYLVIMFE